jgi:hypothetical protein
MVMRWVMYACVGVLVVAGGCGSKPEPTPSVKSGAPVEQAKAALPKVDPPKVNPPKTSPDEKPKETPSWVVIPKIDVEKMPKVEPPPAPKKEAPPAEQWTLQQARMRILGMTKKQIKEAFGPPDSTFTEFVDKVGNEVWVYRKQQIVVNEATEKPYPYLGVRFYDKGIYVATDKPFMVDAK